MLNSLFMGIPYKLYFVRMKLLRSSDVEENAGVRVVRFVY